MLDRIEALERPRAHALGRRIGAQQVGVGGLEVAQLVQQDVVVGVGDLRLVEDVIEVAVMLELRAQLGHALGRRGLRRYSTSLTAGSSSPPRSNPASASTPAESVRSKCSGVTEMKPSAMAAKSVPSSRW